MNPTYDFKGQVAFVTGAEALVLDAPANAAAATATEHRLHEGG